MFDGYREIGTGSAGGGSSIFKFFLLFIFIGIITGTVIAEYQSFFVTWHVPSYNITTLPATNITTSSVTLNGNTGIVATVWFEWGLNGSNFNFKTENMTVSSGNFSTDVSGYGLYPGKTYKYRARGVSTENPNLVMTGNTEYFTLDTVTEIEERNYSKYARNLTKGNLSVMSFTDAITEPYTDRMGLIFWLMLFGLPFVAMFIRGTKVIVPALLALCIGGLIWQFLPSEWTYIAYLLIIVAIAGIIYSIMRSRR